MAKVFIEETTLTAIGDAIRGKTGKTELIDPANMHSEIASIEAGSGGGGVELPEEAFLLTGNCSSICSGDQWFWFFDLYNNKIQTQDITNMNNMFSQDALTSSTWQGFPGFSFTFNVKNIEMMSSAFKQLPITACPKIRGTINWSDNTNLSSLITNTKIQSADDLFTLDMVEGFSEFKVTSKYNTPQVNGMFSNMTALTHIPEWWYKFKTNPESTVMPNYNYTIYYNAFQYCSSLLEVRNIPVLVLNSGAGQTSNMFSSTFNNTNKLAHVTFETNDDGSPITAQWKAQTIDLTQAGHTHLSSQTVPNSLYNHDSAVETINSLPDTSGYLISEGGTNTIKFKKAAGSATDGGAIQNLTEEEIAVATAKGWTVAFT